jgi:hypothetical protein
VEQPGEATGLCVVPVHGRRQQHHADEGREQHRRDPRDEKRDNRRTAAPGGFRSVRFQEEDRESGNTRLRERSTAFAPNLGHRAIAIPDLEAAIRALRLNRLKNLQDDVGLRKPRSSFRCQADEAG